MTTTRISRRRLLVGVGVAVPGGLLAAAAVRQQDDDASAAGPVVTPAPDAAADLLAGSTAAHVARRLSLSPTRSVVAEVARIGPEEWLDHQLEGGDPDPPELTAVLAGLPTIGLPPADYAAAVVADLRARREDPDAGELRPARDLLVATLARGLLSGAPLRELMVAVWSDHLNVHLGHDAATRVAMTRYVEDVLRPHALGRFDDLLVAATRSPAMLSYLDNATSRRGAPNENHARELLELHTLGVGAHDEQDVAEAARVLTGWSVERATLSFRFRPFAHDGGAATVAGLAIPAGAGEDGGVDLLRHLAHHPATASNVARRLAVHFVSDQPTPELVDALAEAYLANETAIGPVLRVLVTSDEFLASAGRKLRRPYEWALPAAASLLTTASAAPDLRRGEAVLRLLAGGLEALGHVPYGWPAPNGYPDVAGPWAQAAGALARWRLAADLAGAASDGAEVEGVLDDLPARLLVAPLSEADRVAIRRAADGAPDAAAVATALVLDHPATHLR